ncbi:cysteine desulfurase family protein [Deinococcus yavapaiensis]|uniref:cysteine desulfurase n=1 Tax=Deinococcus yavapaiensis KR-236 TaxID=694435 RepID=A0A318SIS4_9DEIO|nr:cysteine desulfurase family protein [Deinococcus yavapaiensis]PYE54085.1 cysteine desulfurase [Deinococcus yavapaiensis KR-236]
MLDASRPVYMDYHATTPVDERVVRAMLPYFTDVFANAASVDHEAGAQANAAVEAARDHVARLLGARSDEIVFTSGATEADNLAILGATEKLADKGNHVITTVAEHKAVLDACKHLERLGKRVTYLPVDAYGRVNLDELREAITNETVLISIMAANNEIGTVAPLAEIGAIARERGVLFHTDATQAVGYIDIDVVKQHIDLLSLSAHKFYGPKGVGALYVRKRGKRVRLAPQLHGGGHERGMRSGTLNVPGIVGLGAAADIARKEREALAARLRHLRDRLWHALQAAVPGVELNGHPTERLPHNLSVFIPGVESRSLLVQTKRDVALSTGSACTTASVEPSHVLLALGFGENRAHQSVRFGLGRGTTEAEVDFVAARVADAAARLRQLVAS